MRGVYVLGVVAALAATPLLAETTTGEYGFTYSTLARAGRLEVRSAVEGNNFAFTLGQAAFDKAIVLEGGAERPIVFVPPKVTVTALTIAVPGTDAPEYVRLTPTAEEGAAATSVQFKLAPAASETVSLVGTDGSTATATLRTYEHETGVPLTPDKACAFSFADTQTGTAIRNFYTIDGAPHLRITGTASITRHVLSINKGGEYTLTGLLNGSTFADQGDHVIVVEFSGAGGTLSVDQPLEKAPLVIGTSVKSESAKVSFAACSSFTTSLSLRDGDTGSGGVTFTLPQYHQGDDHFFGPSALLLDCDLTLKSLVPLIKESWLTTHDVPIPAGRTFRLELSEADFATAIADESLLPSLSFADATSRLELATQATTAAENPLGIPAKYQNMLNTQSGTLVLDRDVEASSGSFLATVQNLDTTLILTGDHTFDFGTLFTADDWSEYGRPSNFRTLPSSKKAARVLLVRNSLSTPRSVTLSAWRVVRAQSGLC